MTGGLTRRGDNHKHRHTGYTPCDDRGRDWSDAVTSQGILAATRTWKRQGTDLPPGASRESTVLSVSELQSHEH